MNPLLLWRSPVLIGGLAALLLLAAAYQAGGNAERQRGAAAELRARLETVERDRANAAAAADSAADKARALETLTRKLTEELDALQHKPADDRQPAPGAALDRLYPDG